MEELILDVASNTVSEQGLGPQAAASLRKARALEGRGLSASTYAAVWAAMADFVSSALSQSKVTLALWRCAARYWVCSRAPADGDWRITGV